jgi:hypothetical protein
VGLFVEGAPSTDIAGTENLRGLWKSLIERTLERTIEDDALHVFGFNKGQITRDLPANGALEAATTAAIRASSIGLSTLIELELRRCQLTHVVVAFDALPANENIPANIQCLRGEVNAVLNAVAKNEHSPIKLVRAANALLTHYRNPSKIERGSTHPPRKVLELIFMEKEFEALIVDNVEYLKSALKLRRNPPTKRTGKDTIKAALELVVAAHRDDFCRRAHGELDIHSNPHGVERMIVEQAPVGMFRHPIAQRLKLLVDDLFA